MSLLRFPGAGIARVALYSSLAGSAWLAPAAVHAAVIGTPTYQSTSQVAADRGNGQPAAINSISAAGFNGQGQTQATTVTFIPSATGNEQTRADGVANDTELKSTAFATGPLEFPVPGASSPFVSAGNRSESTRFWVLRAPGQSSVSIQPIVPRFDGEIHGFAVHELVTRGNAHLEFGLDVVDVNNQFVSNAFTVTADLEFTPLLADTWTLTLNSIGVAAGTGWENSFVRRGSASPVEFIHDFDYLATMAAITLPTQQTFGLHWYLETSGLFEGALLFLGKAGVDAGNTAVFDFAISDADLALGATVVEEFSLPANAFGIGLPDILALVLLGLPLLARRARRRMRPA